MSAKKNMMISQDLHSIADEMARLTLEDSDRLSSPLEFSILAERLHFLAGIVAHVETILLKRGQSC